MSTFLMAALLAAVFLWVMGLISGKSEVVNRKMSSIIVGVVGFMLVMLVYSLYQVEQDVLENNVDRQNNVLEQVEGLVGGENAIMLGVTDDLLMTVELEDEVYEVQLNNYNTIKYIQHGTTIIYRQELPKDGE